VSCRDGVHGASQKEIPQKCPVAKQAFVEVAHSSIVASNLQSAICNLQLAICNLQSEICNVSVIMISL